MYVTDEGEVALCIVAVVAEAYPSHKDHARLNKGVSLDQLVDRLDMPAHRIRAVRARLQSSGILRIDAGKYGGAKLAADPVGITAWDVVIAADPEARDRPETVHRGISWLLQQIHTESRRVLSATTLADLANMRGLGRDRAPLRW